MSFVKPNNRLYHYTTLSTALEFILPNSELLLNSLKKTNDPREYKNFVFAAKYWKEADIGDIKQKNKEISELLRNDCKVLCFSDDYEDYFGYEYARMWAHYGDNHKGVCLELDKRQFIEENKNVIDPKLMKPINYYKLDFNNIMIQQKQIDYTTIRKKGLDKYIKEDFRPKYLDFLYFQKNEEWKSEREIRVLHFSNRTENEYCSIQNSLKNIHIGVDFHDSYLPALREQCKGKEIDIYKMEYTANARLTSEKI